MENLWLIPISLLFCSFLYILLKQVLVKWICRTLLHGRVQLECSKQQNEVIGVKIITEGDLAELSLLIMASFMGGTTSFVSLIVVAETCHDSLHARSQVLIPWAHVGTWYYVVDTYAMFSSFMMRKSSVHRKMRTRLILFLQDKWAFLLHHTVLIAVAYPIVVNPYVRGYKGDFYVGLLIAQDISNPFLANAKILNILGLTNNLFYAVNGGLLIILFLIVRVLNTPIAILVYTAQYHQWNVIQALKSMKWMCHAANLFQSSLQFYWFMYLLHLARSLIGDWTHKWKTKIQ